MGSPCILLRAVTLPGSVRWPCVIIIVNVFALLLLLPPERDTSSLCPCCCKTLHPDHLLATTTLNFAMVLSGLDRISPLVLAFLPPPPSAGSNIPDLSSPPPLSILPPHFLYHLLLFFPFLFHLESMALDSLSFPLFQFGPFFLAASVLSSPLSIFVPS
jgi:hypothetical protein